MTKDIRDWLVLNKSTVLAWAFGVMFAFYVGNIASYLAFNTNHQAIVAASDDDAGMVIKLTVKSRWWKDNGLATYGPAFFRLTHSLNYFFGETASPENSEPNEIWERTAHYSIMLVSLFSLVGIAIILASILCLKWESRFIVAFGFLSAFLSHPVWVDFLFRAHPDHMFAFVSLCAFVLMFFYFQQPIEKFWFSTSACLWGIATAVKLSITLWIPGFFLLFLIPFNKAQLKIGLRYLGLMFLGYFLIGFPQTVVLDRPIKTLIFLNHLNLPMTYDSFSLMIHAFTTQAIRPLVIIALSFLFFSDNRPSWTMLRTNWVRLFAFCTIPFLIMVTRNMTVPMMHYPIPFLAVLFALICFALQKIKVFYAVLRFPFSLRVIIFGSIIWFAWGFTPPVLNAQLGSWQKCRAESQEALLVIRKLIKSGKNIWYDPYFPYDTNAPKSQQDIEWRKGWQGARDRGISALALNEGYMGQFLVEDDPSQWVKNEIPNWKDVKEFYFPFTQGNTANTPIGQFKKIYSNKCSHQIWEKSQ